MSPTICQRCVPPILIATFIHPQAAYLSDIDSWGRFVKLRPHARNRLLVLNFWSVPFWMLGGILSAFYLPGVTDHTIGPFVGASAIAVGTIFATNGIQRFRDQVAMLEAQASISVIVGEELLANKARLKVLVKTGERDADGVPLHLLSGPFWLRGADLVRTHMLQLGWTRDFLARVLALYHNLEEAEGLRRLYVQAITLGGPPASWLSLAGRLRQFSQQLLKELGVVEEAFNRNGHFHPASLFSIIAGSRWARHPGTQNAGQTPN